jgi:hypothetical protein
MIVLVMAGMLHKSGYHLSCDARDRLPTVSGEAQLSSVVGGVKGS